MITLFSIPKPFRHHIGLIQRNAVESWVRLGPTVQVILMGDEDGVAEIAAANGVQHIAGIERNEFGTPLVRSIFGRAEEAARHDLLCYANADIIFLSDFLEAVRAARVAREAFLLIGRRWDLEVRSPLGSSPGWEADLRRQVKGGGVLHGHSGIDFLVFRRGLWRTIPDFAIGRPGWDNWMVYAASAQGVPVIDITPVTTVIHQNHDYAHHPQGQAGVFQGPEAAHNRLLLGGLSHAYTILDADSMMTRRGLRRNMRPYALYRILTKVTDRPVLRPLARLMRRVVRGDQDPQL
ncbi:MAG: hypothetical protein A2V88_07695 [Elusimicrobia bacterium RBG_16_66_12]|nr:MAG: hypothetical protein A2V88_07695 [Elusimicrobia bacterium RBG_16_66_12]